MTKPPSFDVVALAKRINERRQEYNAAHDRRLPITPEMSRILENDDEYVPYRKRRSARSNRVRDPRLSTVVEIARSLGTTVGDLLREPPHTSFGPADFEIIKTFLRFIADRL